jgi:hypothetical protein
VAGPNVFAVSRSIWTDEDFPAAPFSEREAWIWLVSAAAWKDIRARGNAGTVSLKRGEFSFSVRFLAEKFQWTKDKTHRFLKRLQKRDTLRDASRDGSSIYSIKNYNRFQVVGLPKRDTESDNDSDDVATAARQQRDKEETGETVKQEIEEQEPPAIAVASLPVLVSRETPKPSKTYPAWLDRAAWAGFVEMRRRKRAPITDRAEKTILTKLDRWRMAGHDPTAILDEATEKSWTTIYEPKDQGSHGQRSKPPTAHDKFFNAAKSLISDLYAEDEQGSGGDGDADVIPIGRPLLSA